MKKLQDEKHIPNSLEEWLKEKVAERTHYKDRVGNDGFPRTDAFVPLYVRDKIYAELDVSIVKEGYSFSIRTITK